MSHSFSIETKPDVLARTTCPSHGILAGTSVMTLDGEMPVEFLTPGDRILTRSGTRRLREVEVTLIQNARVIHIAHSALGVDRPATDLVVSPGQPVLVRDWRAKAMFGAEVAMVPAARLADGEYIRDAVLPQARLFTLRFDDATVIYAGGLELACTGILVTP